MPFDDCSTAKIATVIREYEGVRRKHAIGEMVRAIRIDAPNVMASFGEDAAVIDNGDEALLLAADGIWSRLMEADPYWAGYCAVLVNIHDIAAMGGRPLALVDVFSISDFRIQNQVLAGKHDASLPHLFGESRADGRGSKAGVSREASLHEEIFDECRRRGWIALHGSMAERTWRTLGEPDFVILANGGRVLFVECKTRTGKLSPAQAALKFHAGSSGTRCM